MTIEKLREVLRAQPFKPFDLRLTDGQVIHVPHPEYAAPSPSGRTVVVFEPGETDEYFRVIDLLHVTTLEPRRNGQRPRRGGRRPSKRK